MSASEAGETAIVAAVRIVASAAPPMTPPIADAWPSTVIREIPETASASSAMTTVPPANATALPDVEAAWPIASGTLIPSCRAERARVTMNSE